MRLSKTVDGVEYTYLYKDGLLVQETRGTDIFDYSYDANGSIRMLTCSSTIAEEDEEPMTYYYALNSRGDVIGLYNGLGNLVAKYTYDVWGNEVSITNASGNDISEFYNIATVQPFRYRSYYYDTDSGFYYLQSRYYDPVTHRFINADACYDTGTGILGYNMYAYCNNNPVNRSDPSGMSSHYCGDPTCFKCRPERREFVNNNIDWYNRVSGLNVKCITYTGEVIYNTPIVIDTNSLEYKVLRTIGIGLKSLELEVDYGVGFGVEWQFWKVFAFNLESTATTHWDFSGHSGVDSGPKVTPGAFSLTILGMGYTSELSSFESSVQNKNIANVFINDSVTLCSIGAYAFIGGSAEIGFNVRYFTEELRKVW